MSKIALAVGAGQLWQAFVPSHHCFAWMDTQLLYVSS